MHSQNKDPKKLMEEGWKARENHQFDEATHLLNEARDLFEKEEDWYNATEALNHLAYTEKMRAMHHSIEGVKLAEEALKIADTKGTKKAAVLRALISLKETLGLFEECIPLTEEAIALTEKPAPKADLVAHLSYFHLRTGNIEKALEEIEEAEKLLEEGFSQERDPHRSIWKCKILLTKGLINYNLGNEEEAKELFEAGKKIAQEKSLKTRLDQATQLLDLVG